MSIVATPKQPSQVKPLRTSRFFDSNFFEAFKDGNNMASMLDELRSSFQTSPQMILSFNFYFY